MSKASKERRRRARLVLREEAWRFYESHLARAADEVRLGNQTPIFVCPTCKKGSPTLPQRARCPECGGVLLVAVKETGRLVRKDAPEGAHKITESEDGHAATE